MTQSVGEKGGDVPGRRNLWSKGAKVGAGLACVKNLKEAGGAGVKATGGRGDGDEVRGVTERGSRAVQGLRDSGLYL